MTVPDGASNQGLPEPPTGRVVALFAATAAGAPMRRVDTADALEGRGLRGDRYAVGLGSFSRWPGPHRDITLIAAEALEAAERAFDVRLSDGEHRRNVVVRGLALEGLLRATFRIGGAVLRGERVCAPCRYLVRTSGQEAIFDALRGRGGLRARVLAGGPIRVGDAVRPE